MSKHERKVVCAACKYGETLLAGPRHWDAVMRAQYERLRPDFQAPRSSFEQGFLDQFGVFMTRSEAFIVTQISGQPVDLARIGRGLDGPELYSEGLY